MPASNKSQEWLELARKLDWEYSYVTEGEVFPIEASGRPWLPQSEWAGWDEPYRTSFSDYVATQHRKESALVAVHDAVGRQADAEQLPAAWISGLKLHSALLPLAEFAATIGNLRAGRFGRDSAWRTTALFGALDELRHTQIPLRLLHGFLRWDAQFDWTHRFYHSNNWVAIAARHFFDELLLASDPIEFAIATNFVFETGFTNLQFVALTSACDAVGDRLAEAMLGSIQTDEARHAQIGPAVLAVVARQDPQRAQQLLDKWFWRSYRLFAVATGITMDYLTPVEKRSQSFKEFVQEWIVEQFLATLERYGLQRPWYWQSFEQSLDYLHHMIYASAYSYRASLWFHLVVPGPDDRAWLNEKYPQAWPAIAPIWETMSAEWARTDPGLDLAVHSTAIPAFCHLCQLVLCEGSPDRNAACVATVNGQKRIFCSEPCRWIFESEPERYAGHKDVVTRVLSGEAPGNLVEFLQQYCGLTYATWGKDAFGGVYPWLTRNQSSRDSND